jgi:hypothetical protein
MKLSSLARGISRSSKPAKRGNIGRADIKNVCEDVLKVCRKFYHTTLVNEHLTTEDSDTKATFDPNVEWHVV